MKKIFVTIMIVCSFILCGCSKDELKELPKPEVSEGIRGEQFGIDKNIDETTIDNYLNRSDSVYRDMRMLKDPGDYEAIGGDSYLSGFVKGFEDGTFKPTEPLTREQVCVVLRRFYEKIKE